MNDYINDGEIDLREYWRVIYNFRRLIIFLVAASVLCSGFLNMVKPPLYEATATFFPLNVREQTGGGEVIAMKRQLDIEDLIPSILESRKMADRIIEQIDLKRFWGLSFMTDLRQALKSRTKVTLEKNGIIKLTVQTKSPELSANIANAYVDNLEYFNTQLDIGAQRNIVQVIDRAVTPERQMPRGTVKSLIFSAVISFIFSVSLAFLLEFIHKIRTGLIPKKDNRTGLIL